MNTIETKKDIELLVDTFYTAILKDEQLAPFFAHLNFVEHLPKMVHFWSFVLLDEPGYTTNVTDKHAGMKLNKALFDRWVELFHATVDELFEGEKAQLAKERATVLGWTMASKFNG
ncbi:MAG: group III truncated hemoglobin [Fluviicola sp.]|nr:group III truncated hemoglobin [Fluviicola sp.]